MPGLLPLNSTWSASSTWPASYGQLCDKVGIRTGGRDVNGTYDDWAVLSQNKEIGLSGSVTARVISLDNVDPLGKAGVVVRDNFKTESPSNDARHVNATGYAALMVTSEKGLIMLWSPFVFDAQGDGYGDGFLSNNLTVPGVQAPVYLRLNVSTSNYATGFYSKDGRSWTQVGKNVLLPRHSAVTKAGVMVNSHGGFREGTALFDSIAVGQ